MPAGSLSRCVGTHFPVVRGLAVGCHARQYPNRQQDFEDLAPAFTCQDGPTNVNQGNSNPAPPVTQPSLQRRVGASLTRSPGSRQQSLVKTKHMPTSKAASLARNWSVTQLLGTLLYTLLHQQVPGVWCVAPDISAPS